MRTLIVVMLAATSCCAAASLRAELVTWTLHDVTFDDGGKASGFVRFDPTVPFIPGIDHTQYLDSFDIKTTPGTTIRTPFEFTPANTDASEPWYVGFFSAPEGPTPRHGMPQHSLRLHAKGAWPIAGGMVALLNDASSESIRFEDHNLSRSTIGGYLVGEVVPEPASLAFLGAGLLLLILKAPALRFR